MFTMDLNSYVYRNVKLCNDVDHKKPFKNTFFDVLTSESCMLKEMKE